MFPLVLVWLAALAGQSYGFPVGQGDWSLQNDWSWGDPWDTYYGPWSTGYRGGLLGNVGLAGMRYEWPFDRYGTVLASDNYNLLNPTTLSSDMLLRPYDAVHGYPFVTDVARENFVRGTPYGGAEVGTSINEVSVHPRWRGRYYNGLRFGGIRGGWSDYDYTVGRRFYSNLGLGSARPSSLRLGGDSTYLKK